MTNEEKAEYEARAYRRRLECDTTLCNDDLNAASVEMYNHCLKMAEWKDQQFKEYLEKKRHEIVSILEDITEEDARHFAFYQRYVCLGIIINELFKEK